MADFQRNAALFDKLSAGAKGPGLINITPDQWENLKQRWASMQVSLVLFYKLLSLKRKAQENKLSTILKFFLMTSSQSLQWYSLELVMSRRCTGLQYHAFPQTVEFQ